MCVCVFRLINIQKKVRNSPDKAKVSNLNIGKVTSMQTGEEIGDV